MSPFEALRSDELQRLCHRNARHDAAVLAQMLISQGKQPPCWFQGIFTTLFGSCASWPSGIISQAKIQGIRIETVKSSVCTGGSGWRMLSREATRSVAGAP